MAASRGFSFTSSLSSSKPTGTTFGTPSLTTTNAGSLTFGTPSTTNPSTGFSLGGAKTTGGIGFGAGGAIRGESGNLFGATTTPSTAVGLSLSLGLKPTTTTTAAEGFSFGGSTAAKPGGLFGSATTSTGTGFSFGGAPTAGGLTLGGLPGPAKTSASGLTLGGSLGIGSSGFSLGGSTTTTTAAVSKGLGGVDPLSLASSSTTGTSGTVTSGTSDNKAIKETLLHQDIYATVTSFKSYVKKQKAIREDITRFSVKPYHHVQEEITALKQLLAVVSNGLQRNAIAIHKLKFESAQELKNAEVAHRTQEIPPALQLENYVPTEYFQRLVEQFEDQMHLCRQQIEQMESYMASLAQPNIYTPQELAVIMVKLNETFIALAAQLQSVHEAVRAQKEQYLNYRRVYHSDVENVFTTQKKTAETERRIGTLPMGPGAFDNVSNAAAIAMATALQTAQKPAGIQAAGLTGPFTGALGGTSTLSTGGFGTGTLGLNAGVGGLGGLGATGGLGTTGLGTGGFGTGFGTQSTGLGLGTQSIGLGTGTGLGTTTGFGTGLSTGSSSFGFGTTKPAATAASFGGSLSAGPTVGSTGFGFGSATGALGTSNLGSTITGKTLQLQKPPSKYRKGTR